MDLGSKLKELRKEQGLTQEDVAKAIGVSRRTYILYENNLSKPRMNKYYRLANVLKCKPDELIGLDADIASAIAAGGAGIVGAAAAATAAAGPVDAAVVGAAAAASILFGSPIAIAAAITASALRSSASGRKGSEQKDYAHSTTKPADTKESGKKNTEKTEDAFNLSQKKYKYTASGIIRDALSEKGISFRQIDTEPVDSETGFPQELLEVHVSGITDWRLFHVGFRSMNEEHILSPADFAAAIIFSFALKPSDTDQKLSIVVDGEDLYDAVMTFKDKNALKLNLSCILVDTEELRVVKEDYVSVCHGTAGDTNLFRIV